MSGTEPRRDPAAVSVLVVDDHPVVREGVASQIGDSDALRILGFAESGREALVLVTEDFVPTSFCWTSDWATCSRRSLSRTSS